MTDGPSSARIEDLIQKAEALIDEERFTEALPLLMNVFNLVDEPKIEKQTYTDICATIGDVYYLIDNERESEIWFNKALMGVGGIGNPFIHLRLGQLARSRSDNKSAIEQLLRAYMADGENVFENDPEDLAFLKAHVKL